MTYAIVSGVVLSGAYLLISLGFTITLRIADIPNLAHGAVVAGGMYLTVLLVNDLHVAYYLSIPMVVILGLIPSAVVYEVLLRSARREGHRPQIVFTLLLLSLMGVIYQVAFGVSPRSLNIPGEAWDIFGVAIRRQEVVGLVIAIAATALLFTIFQFTTTGKSMEIAGKYPEGATSIGLPIERSYRRVFLIGSSMALLAGALIVPANPVTPFVGIDYVVMATIISIAARLSFVGCVVVSLAYGVGGQVLSHVFNNPNNGTIVLYGVFLLGIAMTPHARPWLVRGMAALRKRHAGAAEPTS